MSATAGAATVAAVLGPDERARVEAAGNGCFAVLTRESIPEAIRLVRERAVDALLLSVSRCGPEQAPALARLVEACPGLPTVALLSNGLWRRMFAGDPAIVGRSASMSATFTVNSPLRARNSLVPSRGSMSQ